MTKKLVFMMVPVAVLALLLACCESGGKSSPDRCGSDKSCGGKSSSCSSERQPSKACSYCPESQSLKGYSGTVHCDKCNKDMPAGKYCGKCNRFMFEGTVHCDKCDADVPKGKYCKSCNAYMGVKGVGYCAKCSSPYSKSQGCPGCK